MAHQTQALAALGTRTPLRPQQNPNAAQVIGSPATAPRARWVFSLFEEDINAVVLGDTQQVNVTADLPNDAAFRLMRWVQVLTNQYTGALIYAPVLYCAFGQLQVANAFPAAMPLGFVAEAQADRVAVVPSRVRCWSADGASPIFRAENRLEAGPSDLYVQSTIDYTDSTVAIPDTLKLTLYAEFLEYGFDQAEGNQIHNVALTAGH